VTILQKIKLIGHPPDELPFGAGITGRTDINTFSAEYATTNWGNAGQTALVCHAKRGGNASFGDHTAVRYVDLVDYIGMTARLGPDPTKAFDGAPSGPFTTWSARYYFKFNDYPGAWNTIFPGYPAWVSTLDIMNGSTKLDPLICMNNETGVFPFFGADVGKLAIPGRTGFTAGVQVYNWIRCEVQFDDAFNPNMVVRLYDEDDTTPFQTWSYNVPWTAATGLALTSTDNGEVTTGFPPAVSIALLEFADTYNLDGEFPGDGTAVATASGQNPSGTGTPETEQRFYIYPPDQAVRYESVATVDTPTTVQWLFATTPPRYATLTIPGGTPNNEDGWPVVMVAHGGFFVGGDRGTEPLAWRNTLLNAGYAVCSVGYIKSTLTNGTYQAYGTDFVGNPGYGRYPSWIVDYKLAAARLQAASDANGWNLDGSRVFASGVSAGGYIGAAAAVSEGVTNDGGGRDLTIAGNTAYRDGYTGADPTFLGAYVYVPPLDMQAAADYDLNDPGLPEYGLALLGWTDRGSVAATTRPFMGLPVTTATDPDLSYTSVPELVAARDAIGPVPPVACVWGSGDQLINKWAHDPPMAAAMTAAGATYTAVDAETIHDWAFDEFQPAPMLAFFDGLVIDSGGLPGVLSPVDVAVEFAFGYGPGGTPAPGDWVDVTDYVDLTASSPGVRCASGRTNPRQGIRPGTLDFVLDNRDGRFNPRYTSGPYYGELRNGTPVRVTTTYDSTTDVVWRGFVDSGWPQTITSRYPTVTITAHDVLGLMAQGEAPRSAFDAFLKDYSPDHVWKPGPTGWIDAVTGITMRHTGQLEQATGGESIIPGEPAPYGQDDATGYGICEDVAARLDSGADAITILTRVKFPTVAERTVGGLAEAITVIDQAEAGGFSPVRVTVLTESIEILAIDADGLRQAYTTAPNPAVRLMDGAPHTIMVHIPAGSGTILAWIDGRAVEMTYSTSASAYSLVPGDVYVGYAGPAVSSKRPYQGYIDPLVIWRDYVGNVTQLATAAHTAASAGWAGQRLDERITSILEGMDIYDYFGAFDTSGIVARQSYRQDGPLRLLQAIEDTEQGRVWVDRDGLLRFSARGWAWDDTVSNTVQVEFSDDPTLLDAGAQEMLEGGTVITDDPLNIVNVASVTSENGRPQTVNDPASIALYGRRNTLTLTGLLHSTDSQSRAVAEWLLLSQADPQIQARQVSFRVEDNPTVLAPIAAAIQEGWLVRIVKSTTAETLDMQAHVIGVAHDFRFTGWTVTLTLDATRTGYSFFKWGTSNWGGSAGWAF
jgi:acetyl esterase/lipase